MDPKVFGINQIQDPVCSDRLQIKFKGLTGIFVCEGMLDSDNIFGMRKERI